MTIAVMSGLIRPLLEPQLPADLDVRWFMSTEQALELAPLADIGWFDLNDKAEMFKIISAGTNLKWLNSIYAGVDGMPLAQLKAQNTIVTNGAGINAITIAEYVVMAMLTVAKGYRDVVRAQDRNEWLMDSPGKIELFGSNALLMGYGAIGKLIEERLKPFGVDVTVVRRHPGPGTLSPDQWREQLNDFDWVILAVPATPETDGMIGAEELAAMKPSATLINIARGSVIDQDALVTALNNRQIIAWLTSRWHRQGEIDKARLEFVVAIGPIRGLVFSQRSHRFPLPVTDWCRPGHDGGFALRNNGPRLTSQLLTSAVARV